ncbi:MAG: NnrS family protein [Gammaproteobacteria bacterium]
MTGIGYKREAFDPALFQMGFRPFFLGAALFSVFSVLIWMGFYVFNLNINPHGLAPVIWHAHEMIFGYSMAVVAGFLLTAVRNWTEIRTWHGYKLLLLFLLWALARVLPFIGTDVAILCMAITDNLFMVLLLLHTLIPIVKVKQWRQLIFLAIVLLILMSNLAFYTGVMEHDNQMLYRGIYCGFYLIITLIIIMGGRVIPYFIERGAGHPVQIVSNRWIDMSAVLVFLVFWIIDVFRPTPGPVALLAAILFILHGLRMAGWYTAGIWNKPLLWVLYLAYGSLVAGFALKFAAVVFTVSPFLSIHAFGYGGVGLVTIGMMCRIAWGHTGRNVSDPPRFLSWIFMPLLLGTLVRVVLPLFDLHHYLLWIGISQTLWILAFCLFLFLYTPVLTGPRIDGKWG